MGLLGGVGRSVLGGVRKSPPSSIEAGDSFCIFVLHKVYNRVYKSMRGHTNKSKTKCDKTIDGKEKSENS